MKRLSNLLAALVFGSLVIFMSCGGKGGDPEPTAAAVQAGLLTANQWTVDRNSIKTDNGLPDGEWGDFKLTLTGNADGASSGGFTAAGVPTDFEAVWPASGTWKFDADNIGVIDRGDLKMNVSSVTASSLTLTFTVPEQGGRVSGIAGVWSFTFTN